MNTVRISTKISTPEKVGGQNTGCPLHFKKSEEHVPLSNHGSTPMMYWFKLMKITAKYFKK